MLKAKRARTSNRRGEQQCGGEQQRGNALPGRREPKEALAAALGEPPAQLGIIRCCHDPMEDPCCIECFTSVEDCFAKVEALQDKCGQEYVEAANDIYMSCCGYDMSRDLNTFQQFGNVEQGPKCPDDDTDYQDQNNNTEFNGGNPYNCGNSGKEGTMGKLLGGLFNLADKGMCALFNETCDKAGTGESVYCCRQQNSSGNQQMRGTDVAAALSANGEEEAGPSQRCGPDGGPPPDWVPGWAPAGYTSSQYLQAALLAAMTGLGLAYLLGALFGGGDEDENQQQRPAPQQQPTTVIVTGQRPAAGSAQASAASTGSTTRNAPPASTTPAPTTPATGTDAPSPQTTTSQ